MQTRCIIEEHEPRHSSSHHAGGLEGGVDFEHALQHGTPAYTAALHGVGDKPNDLLHRGVQGLGQPPLSGIGQS